MDIKNKNTLYWVLGLAASGYIIWRYRKSKSKPEAVAGNLALAQSYYDKIQALYGSVPKGSSLPESVLNKVVQYEDEIEKQGYAVENNKLVKLSK